MSDIIDKITEYLSLGGLHNPELMEHDKVRDLLIECHERLAELEAQVNRTCLWEIDDVRWYPDALRIVGEKLHRDLSEGVYDRPNYCPACGGKVVSDE